MGHQLGTVSSFQTNKEIDVLIPDLARRIKQVLADYKEIGACEGVGIVVPVDLIATANIGCLHHIPQRRLRAGTSLDRAARRKTAA